MVLWGLRICSQVVWIMEAEMATTKACPLEPHRGPWGQTEKRDENGQDHLASGREALSPEVGRGLSFLTASDPEGEGMDRKVVPQKAYHLRSGYFYHPYKGKG